MASATDIAAEWNVARVHVSFVGNQDHLRDAATQMRPVWL